MPGQGGCHVSRPGHHCEGKLWATHDRTILTWTAGGHGHAVCREQTAHSAGRRARRVCSLQGCARRRLGGARLAGVVMSGFLPPLSSGAQGGVTGAAHTEARF